MEHHFVTKSFQRVAQAFHDPKNFFTMAAIAISENTIVPPVNTASKVMFIVSKRSMSVNISQ